MDLRLVKVRLPYYTYLAIAKVVKEHSHNILWAQEQGAIGSDELDDITFNEAAETLLQRSKGSSLLRRQFQK